MDTNVPADLSTLTADELVALADALNAEFDAKYDDKADLTVLAEIAAANEKVAEAVEAKKAEAAKDAADREELRTRMDATKAADDAADEAAEGEAEATADDDADDADAATSEAADAADTDQGDNASADDNAAADEAPAQERELVTASAKTAPAKPSARGVSSRQGKVTAPATASPVVITASADVPGFATGSSIDRDGLARAFHAKARGLSDGGQRVPVGTVKSPTPDEHIVKDGSDLEAIMASITQLPSGGADALLASGWCTPSETMFDLFSIESRDGLFQLPTMGITRGGIQVPSFFTIGDAAGSLWTWTEDDDASAAGFAITDIDVASNVATATATAHGLRVGQAVSITNASTPGLNGTYAVASVPTANTFTFATSGVADLTNATADGATIKNAAVIPCPTWTDYRLEAEGFAVTHGNLMDRSYPEMTARWLDLVMTAHEHRLSAATLAKVVATATPVTVPSASDAAGDVLNAIDLQVADYRSQYLMSDSAVLEATVPQWLRSAVRATMAMRAGIEAMAVSDAEINAFFTARQVRPQYVQAYEALFGGSAATAWPATSKFLLYPAGGYVKGEGGAIDLGVVRDSTLNSTNDFTAGWSEQFYTVIQRGPNAREVTFSNGVDGLTGGPEA